MFFNFKTIDFYDLFCYPNENRVDSKATKISIKELSNLILTSFEPQVQIFNHPEFGTMKFPSYPGEIWPIAAPEEVGALTSVEIDKNSDIIFTAMLDGLGSKKNIRINDIKSNFNVIRTIMPNNGSYIECYYIFELFENTKLMAVNSPNSYLICGIDINGGHIEYGYSVLNEIVVPAMMKEFAQSFVEITYE